MDFLAQHIEALIFCAPKPLTDLDIQDCLKEMFDAEIPMEDVNLGINNIYQRYKSEYHSFSTPLTVDINSGENWGSLH